MDIRIEISSTVSFRSCHNKHIKHLSDSCYQLYHNNYGFITQSIWFVFMLLLKHVNMATEMNMYYDSAV